MNEWMERQMRGWTPRRPSARVERELFERPAASTPERALTRIVWREALMRLLGPAGAMAMVLLVMIFPSPAPVSTSMAATIEAGRADLGADPSLPGLYHHSVLNHCDYPIFGWTNSTLPPEGIAHFRK